MPDIPNRPHWNDNTFYGQELDSPDDYYTEWHGCPSCGTSLYYCECDDVEDMIAELEDLYARHTE